MEFHSETSVQNLRREEGLAADRPITPIEATAIILRRWRLIAASAVIAGVAALAYILIAGTMWVAEARFMPQTNDANLSKLAGLASQFGVPLGGAGTDGSLDFYSQLIASREILRTVATSTYSFRTSVSNTDSMRTTLYELDKPSGSNATTQMNNELTTLRKRIKATGDLKSGLVTLEVRAKYPGLAEAVARRVLDLVNDFNLNRRRTRASLERQFVQARSDEAKAALNSAERDVQSFQEQNRSYQGSPLKVSEFERLRRRAEFRLQLYTSLSQSLQQARIDEVRNIPVITIVDAPERSVKPAQSKSVAAAAGAAAGAFLGVVFILASLLVAPLRNAIKEP